MTNHRILVIDDNRAIHADIRKIFQGETPVSTELSMLESDLFGGAPPTRMNDLFEIDSAFQGQEGFEFVCAALQAGDPYSVAFIDVRMPPGWDGIETIGHIWQKDPYLQVVLCTAYTDYSWSDIVAKLGANRDGLLILKKPFDNVEVNQLAHALSAKWTLHRQVQMQLQTLESMVGARTAELERANAELVKEAAKRERMEIELRLAQKLESVGQLAAGVAHEINTPIQYIGDSVHFLRESYSELNQYVGKMRALCEQSGGETRRAELEELEAAADVAFLNEQIPKSFERIFDGTERVTSIVRALKEFAHPGAKEMSPTDLNKAILSTLTVARSEYKYIADVETVLGELPAVICNGGDLNQVFLNLIINAAHAIGDQVGDSGNKGRIEIRTQIDGDHVEVAIADTGGGISEDIRNRIFDPFFTTKEIGRGTGQGLAIARSIVVDKHHGALTFESELGRGTTFFIRLPIDGIASSPEGVST